MSQNIILSALISAVIPFSQLAPSSAAVAVSPLPTPTESVVTQAPVSTEHTMLIWTAKSGDTAKTIAASYYGDEAYWKTVWNDNTWIVDPNDIPSGSTVYLRQDHQTEPEELSSVITNRTQNPRSLSGSDRYASIMNNTVMYGGLAWSFPLYNYGYISTQFSHNHPGIDMTAPTGTSVYASTDGTVIESGWSNLGYGNSIVIAHENGYTTRYAHMSQLMVYRGQYVSRGAEIGRVGCTGHCTGSHLHFEFHQGNATLSPSLILHLWHN